MSQTRALKQGAEPKPFNGDVAERGEGDDDGEDDSKDLGAEHCDLTSSSLGEETHLGFHAHPMSNPTTKANHPAMSPKMMVTSKAIVRIKKECKKKGYGFEKKRSLLDKYKKVMRRERGRRQRK